jgi:heme oxygenase
MTTLKELTSNNHKRAEEHSFTKLLLTGNISNKIYATFLSNQLLQYQVLEHYAAHLLKDISGLARSELLLEDLLELNEQAILFKSTLEYCQYAKKLEDHALWAHIYVKHMGDLYGGQVIKQKVPGNGSMYNFVNRQELIKQLRSKLDISMASEANVAFSYAIKLFDEIANEYNL